VTSPAGDEPDSTAVPLGAWVLAASVVLVGWVSAAPSLVPGVVAVGGAVLLGSLAVAAASAWLQRAFHPRVDVPPAGLVPPAGADLAAAGWVRVAWECGPCGTFGWADAPGEAYVAAVLHAAAEHPGAELDWRLVGATAVSGGAR
jgi:hypothetical protein